MTKVELMYTALMVAIGLFIILDWYVLGRSRKK
jgi:hypothetical protein